MGGGVLGAEVSRKRSAVASVTSAEVRDEISDSGKGGKVREEEGEHEAAQCSSGRGGLARNYSVVQGLSTLVLAKVRALSGRQVATHSKTCSSIARGPLRANSGVSISSRGTDGARVLTGQGRSGGSGGRSPGETAARLLGGSAPGRLGCCWAARLLLGGSPAPGGAAAAGRLGGSGRLGCCWAARLLLGGSAAPGRLGCSGRLGCCRWAARLLQSGGARARGGGAVSAGAAGPRDQGRRGRVTGAAGPRNRGGGAGSAGAAGPRDQGRRGRERWGGGAVRSGTAGPRALGRRGRVSGAAGPGALGRRGRVTGAAGPKALGRRGREIRGGEAVSAGAAGP
ncbi:unnamed protein product [Closterium sp. NIES-64]|nr:unnamed protein product [Closterium sp. NIES-64]